MVSRARSFRSRLFSSKGAFFRRLRILRITSVARWLLDEISPTISPSSAISGLGDFRMISALSVLNRIAPSGWFISWAIKAVSSPAVEKRLRRASSAVRCRDCTSANCRRRCSCSRSQISAPCIRTTTMIRPICQEYRSHTFGSRNKTSLHSGSRLSLMFQRWSCRQSYFGAANPIGGTLMPSAFSPPNIRTATAAVGRAPSAGENIGPPTTSPLKYDSSNVKMGALATSWMRFNGSLSP